MVRIQTQDLDDAKMKKYSTLQDIMKFPRQTELDKLVAKIQQQEALSVEELSLLTQLNSELSTWKTDCIKVLDEVVGKIVAYGITLEQLTSHSELSHWSRPSVTLPSANVTVEGGAETKKRRSRIPNPELVIFKIQPPNAKGAPTSIHRGELPVKMGAKLEWLLKQEGELEAKLMACVDSDEARAYLANEEGQVFMDKLLNWIRAQQG